MLFSIWLFGIFSVALLMIIAGVLYKIKELLEQLNRDSISNNSLVMHQHAPKPFNPGRTEKKPDSIPFKKCPYCNKVLEFSYTPRFCPFCDKQIQK
jgi:hypothetical protein